MKLLCKIVPFLEFQVNPVFGTSWHPRHGKLIYEQLEYTCNKYCNLIGHSEDSVSHRDLQVFRRDLQVFHRDLQVSVQLSTRSCSILS